MGGPPTSILAISDLTLGGSTDRADVPIGNAQQSLLQQRDRWFESGSLHGRVSNEPFAQSSPDGGLSGKDAGFEPQDSNRRIRTAGFPRNGRWRRYTTMERQGILHSGRVDRRRCFFA